VAGNTTLTLPTNSPCCSIGQATAPCCARAGRRIWSRSSKISGS
jgi:hypothetical protein